MSGQKKTQKNAERVRHRGTLPAPVEAVIGFGFSLSLVIAVYKTLLSSSESGPEAASAGSGATASGGHVTAGALLTAVDDAIRHSNFPASFEDDADDDAIHHEFGSADRTCDSNIAESLQCDCTDDGDGFGNSGIPTQSSDEQTPRYDDGAAATTTATPTAAAAAAAATMCPPRDGTALPTTEMTTAVPTTETSPPRVSTTSTPISVPLIVSSGSNPTTGVTTGENSATPATAQDVTNNLSSSQPQAGHGSLPGRRPRESNGERRGRTPADDDDSGERIRQVKRLRVLRAENRRLKARRMCRQCHVRPVSLTLLPCGHFLFCQECGSTFNACPVCRKTILADVRTFVS